MLISKLNKPLNPPSTSNTSKPKRVKSKLKSKPFKQNPDSEASHPFFQDDSINDIIDLSSSIRNLNISNLPSSIKKKAEKLPKINGELYHEPQEKIDIQTPVREEFENIEMFSSKKFSDIMKNKNKWKRYEESEEKDESYLSWYERKQGDDGDGRVSPERAGFDHEEMSSGVYDQRIKKVEMGDRMVLEDLGYSGRNRYDRSQSSVFRSTLKKDKNDKVFTTSINLLEDQLFGSDWESESKPVNPKTQDFREESWTKNQNWNFIGSNGFTGNFDNQSTGKKVFVDEFEEFQSDSKSQDILDALGQELYHNDHLDSFSKNLKSNNLFNRRLNDSSENSEVHENVSCFEDDQQELIEHDNIPFCLDDENPNQNISNKECSFEENEEHKTEGEADTLKQMRMMFGSEQRIREQSEQAIQQLNTEEEDPDFEIAEDVIQTPGLSIHDSAKQDKKSSSVFNRKSFQEFSMKKFQELMFDNNMTDFIDSVERSVRQNKWESKTKQSENEEKPRKESSYTPKRNNFVSPRKVSRKELELDMIVGHYMSEKKRQRQSILDLSHSRLLESSGCNDLNKSLDGLSKYSKRQDDKQTEQSIAKEKTLSEVNRVPNKDILIVNNKNKPSLLEKTDQALIKEKLINSVEKDLNESIKRSDVRGLDILISEKFSSESSHSNSQIHNYESEESKTLKYGTDERISKTESAKSIKDQQIMMYGKLDKIMENWFEENATLKSAAHSPVSSSSSPSSKNYSSKPSTLQYWSKADSEVVETPRESNPLQYCYRTPTSSLLREPVPSNFQTITSYDWDRRESTFNQQFYSNSEVNPADKAKDQEKHIYVDGFDEGYNSHSRYLDTPGEMSAPSIGIHTAKNSPFESSLKKDKREIEESSDKYTVTEEESGIKFMSEECRRETYEIRTDGWGGVKRNLQETLQADAKKCSPNNDDFLLTGSGVSHEIRIEQELAVHEKEYKIKVIEDSRLVPDYLDTITPRDERSSPNGFDDSKWVILSNKKWKSIDSDGNGGILDSNDDFSISQDLDKIEYITDEILSMMLFSDIHDNPAFPIRSQFMFYEAKKKFPFNKPLGINTREDGVELFVDQLVEHIKHEYMDDVIEAIQKPISVNPEVELEKLQFYEENSQYRLVRKHEEILASDAFYTLEEIRKDLYDEEDDRLLTEEERTTKMHNTFIHDKMLFDSFNIALHQTSKRKEEVWPWVYGKKPLTTQRHNPESLAYLLDKTKEQMMAWNSTEVGTRKVPPPPVQAPQQTNFDDIFAPPPPVPNEEERNQQLREEKLSALLANEINNDDTNWLRYDDWSTQVKLDLADMILEKLTAELILLLQPSG